MCEGPSSISCGPVALKALVRQHIIQTPMLLCYWCCMSKKFPEPKTHVPELADENAHAQTKRRRIQLVGSAEMAAQGLLEGGYR